MLKKFGDKTKNYTAPIFSLSPGKWQTFSDNPSNKSLSYKHQSLKVVNIVIDTIFTRPAENKVLWIIPVKINISKFLERFVMLTYKPWNLFDHFIRSRIYNVTNQNSCFVSFRSVLEYFVNVYRDSVV